MFLNLIEFFNAPNGDVIYVQDGQNSTNKLKVEDYDLVSSIDELIKKRYPRAYKCLMDLYKYSELNKAYYRYLRVHRFISCNMGNYDTLKFDIGLNGDFMLEEVKCPLRGYHCKFEGIICKPIPVELTEKELEVLTLIAYGKQSKEISVLLNLPLDTVRNQKRSMFRKLKCNNINNLISYYVKYYKK